MVSVDMESTSCNPMLDLGDLPWPTSQPTDKAEWQMCCDVMTSLLLENQYNKKRQMKKIKNLFCLRTRKQNNTNTNQNKGGYPVFPRAHSSKNSSAWQRGCYRLYHRLRCNGLCGEETSCIVFSQASFQAKGWTLRALYCCTTAITVVLLLHSPPH